MAMAPGCGWDASGGRCQPLAGSTKSSPTYGRGSCSVRAGRDREAERPAPAMPTGSDRTRGRCRSEQRVDERRHRGSLREHDQAPEQEQNDDDREEPELLSLAHERPELQHKLAPFTPLLRSSGSLELSGHM